MKTFSPAGMANKGFYGGPGWPFGGDPAGGGRSGQSGARTIGNPDGALSGGGAYLLGGANPDGPNQGGFVPGGSPIIHGVFTMGSTILGGFENGYADGNFANDHFLVGGSATPQSISGHVIGAFWCQDNAQLYFGVYGQHNQTDFTSLSFTDQNGVHRLFLSSNATFNQVTQTSPPAPDPNGGQWVWAPVSGQFFAASGNYVVTVDGSAFPASWNQANGISSTGPLQNFVVGWDGDGSGFYDGNFSLNGGFGSGSTTPSPVTVAGATLNVCGWGSQAPFGGPYFAVVLQGTFPQNLFTNCNLGAPANLNFATASCNRYSTTDFPGFTVWAWSDSHEFSFFPPFTVTLT